MIRFELDHWVLFDTMSTDQIDRLKKIITKKTEQEAAAAPAAPGDSFQSMLDAETAKLERR